MARYYTPLRYPGGKQKLAPFIREILEANDLVGGGYVEPYAGGAGVALELLIGRHVEKIYLNDSALPVFAFWKAVLEDTESLCRLISSASLTVEEWKLRREVVRNPEGYSRLELGFSTFYLNRCNRSGVLSGGVIGGLNQTGEWKMDARFSRNELIRRIEVVAARRDSIVVTNLDAENFISGYVNDLPQSTLVYCDPPYFEKAGRLYLNSYQEADHERLATFIQNSLNKNWIVSYDSSPQILNFYKARRSFLYDLQYNASTVYKGKEIFVFSDGLKVPQVSSLPYIDCVIKNLGPLGTVSKGTTRATVQSSRI